MKVVVKSLSEEMLIKRDYCYAIEIDINDGKKVLRFFDGEPEDNSIGRNFNDVFCIGDVLEMAWEAGKRGEEFVIERADLEW